MAGFSTAPFGAYPFGHPLAAGAELAATATVRITTTADLTLPGPAPLSGLRVWIDMSRPRTLVDLDLGASTGRYASVPVNGLAQPYIGRLLDEPVVRRRIVDVFWGPVEVQEVQVSLANLDGHFTAAYAADLRGRAMMIQRHDATYGVTVTEWIGQVEQASLTGEGTLEIEGTNLNLAIFDEEIPKRTVTTTIFPLAIDVGMAIPVVFGNVPKVRLPYVRRDIVGGFYDYVIEGPVTFAQLWRNGPNDSLAAIAASEYTVSGAIYPGSGLTTVRFPVQQIDFQGAPHEIYADVIGYATERNFVRAVQRVLSDTSWGLSQTIDTANFDAAAATLTSTTGGLLCDGALTETHQAKDVLRQLLMVRGLRLAINALGQWQITVDTNPGAPVLALRDGPGSGTRNVLDVGARSRVAASDRPKKFILHYRPDLMSDEFLFLQERTLESTGREIPEENQFIRDHTTADKVTDYMGKRLYYGQETVENVRITPAARTLVEGQLVTFAYPTVGYSGETLEVRDLEKGLDVIQATLASYSSAIHIYTPGVIPTDEITGGFTDLSRVAPDPPTSVTVIANGPQMATDGGVTSTIHLQWTPPAVNFAMTRLDVKLASTTSWTSGAVLSYERGPGAKQAGIGSLVPGSAYDFRLTTISPFNLASTPVLIASTTAGNDGTIPPIPTIHSLSVANRALHVLCSAPASDLAAIEWDIYTGANGTGLGVTAGSHAGAKDGLNTWAITGGAFLAYGVTYHLRVRAVDASGNRSSYSASSPFAYTTQDTPDITPGAISSILGSGGGSSSITAAGLSTPILMATVSYPATAADNLLAYGGVTLINGDTVKRLARAWLTNATNGHQSALVEITVPPGDQQSFVVIALDAVLTTEPQVVNVSVAMAGTASWTCNYRYVNVSKLQR